MESLEYSSLDAIVKNLWYDRMLFRTTVNHRSSRYMFRITNLKGIWRGKVLIKGVYLKIVFCAVVNRL
jgi:hypothetical protein